MQHITRIHLRLVLVMLLMAPMSAHAIPAITCHCFTERSYEKARPAAADPYFLATTQNTFFSIVFNADKKTVVMKKQQGTSPDDLWIAYWLASKSGSTPDDLLNLRLQSDSWKDVIAARRLPPISLGILFSNALNAGVSTARLSEKVVDEMIVIENLLVEGELAALRKAGASNQELIISAVIAARTRQPATQLYQQVKGGVRTWGSLLSAAKIDTKNMQQEIAGMLKQHFR